MKSFETKSDSAAACHENRQIKLLCLIDYDRLFRPGAGPLRALCPLENHNDGGELGQLKPHG